MIFAIDPGHGDIGGNLGGDGGAIGYLNEQKEVLDIAEKVIAKLIKRGHKAINVRPNSAISVRDSLQKRCDGAYSADYLVSIHLNAGGGQGSEVYAMSKEGYKLGENVLSNLASLGFKSRGTKDGSNLYVIRRSRPVAILIEAFFIDSMEDYGRYKSLGSDAIAEAIVRGLLKEISGSQSGNSSENQNNNDNKNTAPNIKELQKEFNKQFHAGLVEDGIYGPKTQEAANRILVLPGARGEITRWIQRKLIYLGYNVGKYGADSIYGTGTREAVRKLQLDKGLSADGIVGQNTWNVLLSK